MTDQLKTNDRHSQFYHKYFTPLARLSAYSSPVDCFKAISMKEQKKTSKRRAPEVLIRAAISNP